MGCIQSVQRLVKVNLCNKLPLQNIEIYEKVKYIHVNILNIHRRFLMLNNYELLQNDRIFLWRHSRLSQDVWVAACVFMYQFGTVLIFK